LEGRKPADDGIVTGPGNAGRVSGRFAGHRKNILNSLIPAWIPRLLLQI
jgi:hypothetical protein